MFISIKFTETSIDKMNKIHQKAIGSKFRFKISIIHMVQQPPLLQSLIRRSFNSSHRGYPAKAYPAELYHCRTVRLILTPGSKKCICGESTVRPPVSVPDQWRRRCCRRDVQFAVCHFL